MKKLCIFFLTTLLLAGLTSCQTDEGFRAYVQADRDTFNLVAPDYEKWVQADESLDADQKERRSRLIESWGSRISGAEKSFPRESEE